MPRERRLVLPGYPHHVTHRGDHRSDVFLQSEDYSHYLSSLAYYTGEEKVRVWAYCLMTNHVHLIAVPQQATGLTRLMRRLESHYARYLQGRHRRDGHVWGERFFSSPVDGPYLVRAVRYVERNPVRAGLVDRAEQYRWSSAACHCAGHGNEYCSDDMPLLDISPPWVEWLRAEDESELADLRVRTRRGIPCGGQSFLQMAEQSRQGTD